jgi:hypothetical protein
MHLDTINRRGKLCERSVVVHSVTTLTLAPTGEGITWMVVCTAANPVERHTSTLEKLPPPYVRH